MKRLVKIVYPFSDAKKEFGVSGRKEWMIVDKWGIDMSIHLMFHEFIQWSVKIRYTPF